MRLPVLLLLLLPAVLLYADGEAAPAPRRADTAPSDIAGLDRVAVSAHRAIYDMSLTSVKNGSSVSDVSGTMLFEWADVCDGWAIQQNMQLHFAHAEGDTANVTSNEVTWESKDGKRYNFNIRRTSDGKETENNRGKANVDDTNKAVYSNPEGKVVELTPDTLFPSMHTRTIIAAALSGTNFFTRRVFDGTEDDGQDDVSVFIGQASTHPQFVDDRLKDNPLLAATEWPVHMAFFKLKDDTGAPDFEMDLNLLANGVVRSMRIDYGDFSVTGTLKAIEALPAPHC